MKLDNVKKLMADDFEEDQQELVERIAEIINPFMENVGSIFNGNVDFDNLRQEVRTFEVTVGGDQRPTASLTISTSSITGIQGAQAIYARNVTLNNSAISGPVFLEFEIAGSKAIKVNKIHGLIPNLKYLLRVLLIG